MARGIKIASYFYKHIKEIFLYQETERAPMNLDFSSETSNSMFGKSYRGASAKPKLGGEASFGHCCRRGGGAYGAQGLEFRFCAVEVPENGRNSGGCSVESACMFLGTFQIGFLLM